MYIVHDINSIKHLQSKYLVLELDTIEFLDGRTLVAYALVDNQHIPLQEAAMLEELHKLHVKLIENYKKQDWHFCKQAIKHLMGRFKGEIDTFYQELGNRIQTLETLSLTDEWTGNIITEQ